MTDEDFKKIADLLKHAAGHCEDGVDACEHCNVDLLCTALIYAHEAKHEAMNDFTAATRRKQYDPDAERSGVDVVS